ncbi:glycosyltransferase family 2 protein [Microvirga pakistanensis]|uniref:glycosyltransferase family 2 protein n=1 Tax=Microvirga pakistanensis TaxID=1682650 RepID=UPI001FCE60F4|nr:glycosyltransferase family 2 protein [Microvirga pakistanensis]
MASIDVVIPSYQYGRYLRECVQSVLDQDVDELRVLIIDNGSTDGSADIARQLAAEDARVSVVAHSVNRGPHASFNEGIDWATADYFLLLFADDLLTPGALSRAIAIMEEHPDISVTYGRAAALYGDAPASSLEIPPQKSDWRIMDGLAFIDRFCRTAVFHVPGSALIVRTSAQKQAGHYRPELPHSDDYDVWLRLACRGRVAETDAFQAILRMHGSNRSTLLAQVHVWHLVHTEMAIDCFFANDGAALPGASNLLHMARRSLAERAYWSAVSNLARGSLRDCFALLRFAVRRRPSLLLLPPLGYLLRRDDTSARIRHILMNLIPGRQLPATRATLEG